jgi:integrin alpha FG-GAP repeat containing protein 1
MFCLSARTIRPLACTSGITVHYDCCLGSRIVDLQLDEFMFKNAGSFHHPRRVHNVIPGDFTQDGTLDLLVVADGVSSNTLSMSVYPGNIGGGFGKLPGASYHAFNIFGHHIASSAIDVPAASSVEPFVVDTNGDMKIDLLGHTSASSDTFKIWQNVWNSSEPKSKLFDVFVRS